FEYNVSTEFFPFARRVLASLYPDNDVVPWGMFRFEPGLPISNNESRIIGISLAGYAVLPEGNTIQDYPDLISYLENGEPCITGRNWELSVHLLKPIRLYQ